MNSYIRRSFICQIAQQAYRRANTAVALGADRKEIGRLYGMVYRLAGIEEPTEDMLRLARKIEADLKEYAKN